MKRRWDRIVRFFTGIDGTTLGKSVWEVVWMTLIALGPLIFNIAIAWIKTRSFDVAIHTKILPGEILSYSLGFIAPSLYLLTKSQGTAYRLPWVHLFSIVTLLTYGLALVLYLVAKNKWIEGIDLEHNDIEIYFVISLVILAITILFRIYTTYHRGKMVNWTEKRNKDQKDFNTQFTNSLPKQ